MMEQKIKEGSVVVLVGCTGLVGREFMSILLERGFPLAELRLIASDEEVGHEIPHGEDTLLVKKLAPEVFKGADVAFFCSTEEITKQYAPIAVEHKCIVIDNSTAFRLHQNVPLLVFGVNELALLEAGQRRLISSPNCVVAHLSMVLKPILDEFGLKRVVTSTYQSTSGAGAKGMEELSSQVKDLFNYRESDPQVFPHRIAFNLIPEIGPFDEDGYSQEECSIIQETVKVLNHPSCKVSATAVRVPTFHGHAQSVNVQTEKAATVAQLRTLLEKTDGIILLDEPKEHIYPVPSETQGQDEVFVGRIRNDPTMENSFHLWIVSDNVRKGAALNVVQIMEYLFDTKNA